MLTVPRLPAVRLTPAELEVLSRLPHHQSARDIADEAFVSTNTVRSHIKSIYLKLGVSSRAEAVRCARQLQLLPPVGPDIEQRRMSSAVSGAAIGADDCNYVRQLVGVLQEDCASSCGDGRAGQCVHVRLVSAIVHELSPSATEAQS